MKTTTRNERTTVTVTARFSDDARSIVAQSSCWPDLLKIALKSTIKGTEVRATFRAAAAVSLAEWQRMACKLAA
jgi:hypothetical protein